MHVNAGMCVCRGEGGAFRCVCMSTLVWEWGGGGDF